MHTQIQNKDALLTQVDKCFLSQKTPLLQDYWKHSSLAYWKIPNGDIWAICKDICREAQEVISFENPILIQICTNIGLHFF